MTERKRSKKSNPLAWGVMGVLVLAMGGFGLSGAFLNTGGSAVATVGDEEISVDMFFAALRQDVAQASQDFGFPITLEQAQAFGIDQVTLRRLLSIAALNNESGNLNISVGDDAVRNELVQNPAFRGLSGGFDTSAYDFALQQIGMSRDEYDVVVRDGLTQTLIRAGIAQSGSSNDTAVDTVMGYIGELRDFDWVLINADALSETASEPTEAELQAFYDANPALFTQPETRDVTYIALTPEMLAADIDVAEADIVAEYDARGALYNTDASIFVDRIAFGTLADAEAAKAQIDAGEAGFDDIASARGLLAADISLGLVTEYQISSAAADVLFSATDLGVYGPIESAVGPALFRLNSMQAASSTPLDEVRDEIRDAIALNAAGNLVVGAFDDVDDLIAGGASLEDVANETDMQLFTTRYPGETTQEIESQSAFISEVLAAEIGEERDILETDNGGIFVVRVDGINPEFVRPLAETRDIAIAGQMAARNQELVLEHAATLQSLIDTGADFAATMAVNGLTANTVTRVSRNSPADDTPPTVLQAIFELEKNETAIVDDIDGAYLVRLTNLAPYDRDNAATAAVISQIEAQIAGSIEADIFAYYTNALMGEAGFTVDQPLISAIVLQNSGGLGGNPPHGQPGHVHNE